MNSRGFTLIEVIIAVVILTFLTLFTSESIRNAVSSKKKIIRDIDRFAEVRDALRVMERDINMAFNYRDINIDLYNEAQKEREKRKQEAKKKQPNPDGTTPDPDNNTEEKPFVPKEQKILTQFRGSSNELHFSTRSYVRMAKDEQASDQAEVGYSLKTCKSRVDPKKQSQCLWRRIAKYVDDDIEKGGDEVALLENVQAFEMRYLGPDKDDWASEWKSGEGGDDVTKGKFPYAVEITIETQNKEDPLSKSTRMTMVASLRNPNNPIKKETKPEGQDGNGTN